jgi:DNA-binding MarR family transcriptional regulator
MSVEPMTLVGFLDRLEARDLIQRSVDPSDRRAKLISPTAEATPLIQRIDDIGNRIRKTATANLNRAEAEALRTGLVAMREALASEVRDLT